MSCTNRGSGRDRRRRLPDFPPPEQRVERLEHEKDWSLPARRIVRFHRARAQPSICLLQPFIIIPMQARDRLIVAADLSASEDILVLADELEGLAGAIKIGLQAFVANGPRLVRDIVERGSRVFLDLKLHDIPNTVEHAVREAERLGVAMLTVHAAGGAAMLRSAKSERTLILAVTVLTSLADDDLQAIGMSGNASDSVARLALLAQHAGVR